MILTITEIDEIIRNVIGVHSIQYKDDLRQECYLFALEAEAHFDGTPNQFKRYLGKSLKGMCKNYLNDDRGGNRIVDDSKSIPIDENISDDDDSITLSETISDGVSLDDYLEAKDYVEQLGKIRSDRDMKIMKLHTLGWTAREIIKGYPKLGLRNQGHVDTIIKSFKKI